MPLADYAHHNEDAERIWWEEEGKHADFASEDALSGLNDMYNCFIEELYEYDEEDLRSTLSDADYNRRWPKARPIIEAVMRDRGFKV